ncbi:hypothetical protein AKJ16_DCAP20751 [Drosera capensis]
MTDSSYKRFLTSIIDDNLLLKIQQQVELKLARVSIPWQQVGSCSSSVRVVFPVAGKVSKYRDRQRCSTNISDGFWSMILGGMWCCLLLEVQKSGVDFRVFFHQYDISTSF